MKTKATLKIVAILLLSIFITNEAIAQRTNRKDKASNDTSYYRVSKVTPPLIEVAFNSPQTKKEKRALNNSIEYGKVWETGANGVTKVKFNQDVVFGNVKVAAGIYALFTIPGEKEWKIILSDNVDVKDASQYFPVFDVARITIPLSKVKKSQSFSITFKEKKDTVQMILGLNTTKIAIPISFKNNELYAKL